MERYLYACDLLNSFEARTYLVVVFGKSWKMAARDDFWDRFDTRVVPLSIERGVRHWHSAPTRVVQRTCRVRTRVPTRVDYMSKRMHLGGERIWIRKYMRVVTARVFCVLRCSFTSTSNSGRRQRHLTWSSHPRRAHLLMLQGREINLLFLSPAPGIEPGSAGVRLQCLYTSATPPHKTHIALEWIPYAYHN